MAASVDLLIFFMTCLLRLEMLIGRYNFCTAQLSGNKSSS